MNIDSLLISSKAPEYLLNFHLMSPVLGGAGSVKGFILSENGGIHQISFQFMPADLSLIWLDVGWTR